MKKLIITFCFMLLCIALFNSRVYAVFVTNIDNFVQTSGSNTFSDDFGDGNVPVTGATYDVEANFDGNEESGGKLALDLDDGVVDEDGLFLGVSVEDSSYFFSSGVAGSVTGLFDVSGGVTSGTWFGIDIYNFPSVGDGEPASYDEAFAGISRNEFGTFAVWGDETTNEDPLGFLDITSLIAAGDGSLGIELTLATSGGLTAKFDFGDGSGYNALNPLTGDGISSTGFSSLNFSAHPGDLYTGAFAAGEMTQPVPEPATIALLGIGLAGLGGGYLRRRKKQKAD